MNKTLAIVGSHPRTREEFDFNRQDVDVWLFNEAISNKANTWAKRADVIFQMHVPPIWRNPKNRNDPHHYEWLQTQNEVKIIYMQDMYPDVPCSVKYPIEEIHAMVGNRKDHFLTSSVPQAMALAAYLKQYDRIEIYGVAMETNTEWQFQREGVAFWRGYLEGQGVDVYFADPTFEAPLYGYEGEVFIKEDKITDRIAQLQPERDGIEAVWKAKNVDFTKALNLFFEDASMKNEELLMKAMESAREAVNKLGILDGAIQENQKYLDKAKTMKEVSGDFVFSRQEFESSAKTLADKGNSINLEMNAIGVNLASVHRAVKNTAKGSKKYDDVKKQYHALFSEYFKLCNISAVYHGASSENFRYMSYLDKTIRAAGGEKAEEVLLKEVKHD